MRPLFFYISLVMLLGLISCHKENTRFSYQEGIDGSQSYVTAQQMMTQLLNTYFKSLTDSTLIADGQAKIDGADVYYNQDPESILIKYPWWGAGDGYGHWRINPYEAIPRTSFDDPDGIVDLVFYDFSFDKDTLRVQDLVIEQVGEINMYTDKFRITSGLIERQYADSNGVQGVLSFSFDQEYIRYKDPESIYTSTEDYFRISGTLEGTSQSGIDFGSVISDDSTLWNSFSCNWLNNGLVAIVVNNFKYESQVFFSEQDSCQNQYMVFINNNPFSYPID